MYTDWSCIRLALTLIQLCPCTLLTDTYDSEMYTHHISPKHIQECKVGICVPVRLRQKWQKSKSCPGEYCIFRINQAVAHANVRPAKFVKIWRILRDKIPDNELFALLKKAFSRGCNLARRVEFVHEVMRQYKAMGEPVCLCSTRIGGRWHACILLVGPVDRFAMHYVLHSVIARWFQYVVVPALTPIIHAHTNNKAAIYDSLMFLHHISPN